LLALSVMLFTETPVSISQHTADGRDEVWPAKTQLRLVATSRSPEGFRLLQRHNVWSVK
jgi:hypothetical protein